MPDKRTVSDFKCKKSLHQEIQAAQALGNKKEGTQVTLHNDTMSRSKVDGEWPSLTLNFLSDDKQDCKMYPLRTLFLHLKIETKLLSSFLKHLKDWQLLLVATNLQRSFGKIFTLT